MCPNTFFEDFFHPPFAASLGVAVPVKSIEHLRKRVTFQDWNVRIVFSLYQRGLRGKSFQLCIKLSRDREIDY